jgi:hypothetical protein
MYRQGDVILEQVQLTVDELEKDQRVEKIGRLEIASENGNRHVLNARAYNVYGQLYVVVEKPTPLTHPQHPMLIIEPGIYRVRFVRDYVQSARPVD